ncbi:MAG: response regulator transcription factor [Saprospiraceae bacterium]|nr:response regulator transcription factor [Saprospiraceae bacterium]
MTPIRIALSDDQELFIESLSALLSNLQGEVEVVWSAKSGEETLEKVAKDCPDVLLLDYFFKGKTLDGGETCRILHEIYPELGILMLSVSCEISIIRQALQNGASGYASKDIGKAELVQGIHTVASKGLFLDQTALREVASVICSATTSGSLKNATSKTLITPRELEVAPYYVKGKSVREIAESLFISEDTVESHIKNIRSKTGATSRYEVGEWLKKHALWQE